MKTIYKTVGIVGMILIAMPFQTYAAQAKIKDGGFCKNIDMVTEKFREGVLEKTSKFKDRETTRMANLNERREKRNETRTENRGQVDIKRDIRIDDWQNKAQTESQKTAVANFEKTLDSAVAKRRASVDLAVTTFRSGVDEIINGKLETLDKSVVTFQNSIDSAIDKAKTDCASSKNEKEVRAEFRNSIKSARDAFKNTRPDEIKTEIKALGDARRADIENAVSTFKETMRDAVEALKTAFKA